MAVTRFKIAQLANGTDGELITWDASGVPATVAVGTAGHVLTSNGIGAAPTFQAVSGGGSSSGISGAVQFSGGSGTFSSDATNFFFNDSTNRLELAGGTSTNLLIAGLNGGITVTPSSSITGFYNVLNSQFSATGNINLNLYNTNTTDSTANARIALTTSTGGGDPFLLINTAEAGYILGVDNSGGDKFYIGTGTTPSSMTVSNIIIDGTKMGVQQATPTAKLHLAAGSATSNTAPLKIDTGTALATPEDGAMEYHSSHLYFTIGSTRYQLDQQAGTLPMPYVAKTAAYTIVNTDYLIDCTSGTYAITLPTAASITGKVFIIKNSGTGVITINTTSSQTLDGTASGVITMTQYDVIKVMSNGTNWIII